MLTHSFVRSFIHSLLGDAENAGMKNERAKNTGEEYKGENHKSGNHGRSLQGWKTQAMENVGGNCSKYGKPIFRLNKMTVILPQCSFIFLWQWMYKNNCKSSDAINTLQK